MSNQSFSSPIQAAFFDIDGTLTSFRTHEIPQSTVQALQELQHNDIRIFICTGRAPSQMQIVLNTLPIHFDGIVGVNGQYCWNDEGLIYSQAIAQQDVHYILDWLEKHDQVVACFSEARTTYFNHDSAQLQKMWSSLGKTAPLLEFINPSSRVADHPIYQISPYIDENWEQELVNGCPNIRGVRWHPDFVDLIPRDGGKNRGMDHMLDHYGIDLQHTIAFGDGGNDIDMLRHAHIGVAMGNATAETKAAADHITDDVDAGGIYHALQHYRII